MLAEVRQFLASSAPVSLDRVRTWMSDVDEETLGAVYVALTVHADRIVPRPDPMVVPELLLRIMQVGQVRAGPRELSLSPYDAGDCLLELALEWVAEQSSPRLASLRDLVATTYLEADEHFRTRIVHGFLEHAFEHASLRALFAGWKSAPVLSHAYAEAALWADDREN